MHACLLALNGGRRHKIEQDLPLMAPPAGCNDGLVPLVRGEGGLQPEAVAEERRLFFVSLTRAKQRLRLSHTRESSHYGRQNRKENERSRFLKEVFEAGHAILRDDGAAPQARPHVAREWGAANSRRQQRYGALRHAGRGPAGGGSSSSGSSRRSSSSSSSSGGAGSSSSSGLGSSGNRLIQPHANAAGQPGGPPSASAAQENARKRGGRR
jgi:hypothetical protein